MAERNLGEVARDTAADIRRLVQLEIRLAVEGMKRQLRGLAVSLGAAGAGALLLLYGLLLLLVTAALALALVMSLWASFLIVGGGVTLAGALLAGVGASGVRSKAAPLPEDTRERLTEDAKWLLQKSG